MNNESGEADRLGDLDTVAGEGNKQSLSDFTALTHSGLLDAPCFPLITSLLLLFTISGHKVMIQDFQSLSQTFLPSLLSSFFFVLPPLRLHRSPVIFKSLLKNILSHPCVIYANTSDL